MAELSKDPKTIAAARRHLLPDETVLWAARQRGVGRRGVMVFAANGCFALAVWGITALMGTPGFIVPWLVLASPFYLFWTMEMLSRRFIATDRRVVFISGAWPFRWSYWNYAELDVNWVRFGKGRSIIHLLPFPRGIPRWVSNGAVYPNYVENVRDIEPLRELILAHIARSPEPVAEPAKFRKLRKKGPRHPVHGTRTG